jgi:hypothetical protein
LQKTVTQSQEETQPGEGNSAYSNADISSLILSHEKLRLDPRQLDKLSLRHVPATEEDVCCICEWNYEDGSMVQCQHCQKWQHLICYGYTKTTDFRLPAVFVCAHCLESDEKSNHGLNFEFRKIALLRSALLVLWNGGYANDEQFRKEIRK